MNAGLLECVPNFSEGKHSETLAALVTAVTRPGVAVLGHTADVDHHRAVLTLAGRPEPLVHAAFAAVATAVERIDIRSHAGVHPRLGAADVVPFVPLAGTTMVQAVEVANQLGERIWRELRVPVYFYEAAARAPARVRLEQVRRGRLAPDLGGPGLHPSAGACIVGARPFLIAWNVNLDSADLRIAKRIAAAIRESSGGLPCVKALGLALRSRGIVQVSMNLTDFETTSIPVVYDRIATLARAAGVRVREAELIGFLPRAAFDRLAGADIPFGDLGDRVIEDRIAALLPSIE